MASELFGSDAVARNWEAAAIYGDNPTGWDFRDSPYLTPDRNTVGTHVTETAPVAHYVEIPHLDEQDQAS